jgi:hypothetical protein
MAQERTARHKGYSQHMSELFASRHLFYGGSSLLKGRERSTATRTSTTLNNTTMLSRNNESNLKPFVRTEADLLSDRKFRVTSSKLFVDSPRKHLVEQLPLNRDRVFRISASVNRSLKWNKVFDPSDLKSQVYLSHQKPADPAFQKSTYDDTLLALKRMVRGVTQAPTKPADPSSALNNKQLDQHSPTCGDPISQTGGDPDSPEKSLPRDASTKLTGRDATSRDIRNQVRQLNYALALKRIKNLQLDADQYLDYIIVAHSH